MARGKLRVKVEPGADTAPLRVSLPDWTGLETAHIRLGMKKLPCRVRRTQSEAVMQISSGAAERLGLSSGMKLAYSVSNDIIIVGPVIGILTVGERGGRVGGNRQLFRYLQGAGDREGALVYAFTPEGVNWQAGRVRGYRHVKGRWVSRSYPLPTVVYNRAPNRALEGTVGVRNVKRRYYSWERQGKAFLFNPCFLNKAMLYGLLSRHRAASGFLPWTRVLQGQSSLASALLRYPTVYLKPKNTFAGKGIMRVTKRRAGFVVEYREGKRNRKLFYSSQVSLMKAMGRLLDKPPYVLQQGIDLAKYRGRSFDARVLVQRNGQGEWEVAGVGIRVAGAGSITTHVPNGGYIASAAKVIKEVFGETLQEPNGVYERVVQVAHTVAPLIEDGIGRTFGEMTMDIGIDSAGRPWFFEANAKPMKFDEKRIRERGLANLIGFSRFKAGMR